MSPETKRTKKSKMAEGLKGKWSLSNAFGNRGTQEEKLGQKKTTKNLEIKNIGRPKTPCPPPISAEEEEAFKEKWRKSVDGYYAQDNSESYTQPPLKELEKLVDSIQPEIPQQQQQPIPPPPPVESQVLEEGEIPDSGNYQYGTLEELLASVGSCFPCPIHNEGMNEIHSQKEWIQDVFLKCQVENCPVFTSLKDYNSYYDGCRRQGNDWLTLARVASMKCECGETPTLAMSKSEKNFLHLYLRCRNNYCKVFQWWRYCPKEKNMTILTR
ncbi:hypothetical protein AWC38_SpisGene22355 [Stylophora pistillata]|uniref:Uncharacterized protein n=1 Tax=Stylophora pistillata TaxID=50429 RepID=A0A2B4R7D3_STYPI|nr:hypothetical protein AWC38_SpisGene22355 [Stylophora pistillata]